MALPSLPAPRADWSAWGAAVHEALANPGASEELRAAYASVVTPTGAGDQTAHINAALAVASPAGTRKTVRLVGAFTISAPLIIPSRTTLDATAAGITLAPGSNCNMLQNTSVGTPAVRDEDVHIVGGRWDRGANGGGTALANHTLLLRRIDRCSVTGGHYLGTAGKFAVSFGDVTAYRAQALRFNTSSDGVHVNGPARHGYIGDIGGTTGDDMVAFTCNDYAGYNDVAGNISDVVVEGLYPLNAREALKLLSGSGYTLRGVSVTGVYGSTVQHGVTLNDDSASVNTDGSDIDGVSIRDVRVKTGAGFACVHSNIAAGKHLLVDGVTIPEDAPATQIGVWFNATSGPSLWETVDVRNVAYNGTAEVHLVQVNANTTIRRLAVHMRGVFSTVGRGMTISGNVDRLVWSGSLSGAAHGLYLNGTCPYIEMIGLDLLGTTAGVTLTAASGTTEVTLNGVTSTASVTFSHIAAMAVRLRGGAFRQISGLLYFKNGSQTFTVNSLAVPVDLTRIVGAQNGDVAHNSNAALSSGVGPAVYDSTAAKWKNLYSGALYPA